MTNPNMQNYHDLLKLVMDTGTDQLNTRTGKVCRAIVGHQIQYDLREGFPAITTKKLAFKTMVGELLGFFRGYDNAADFRALGCRIWDANANETQGWLDNPNRKGEDDLGKIYGCQWTAWSDKRLIKAGHLERYLDLGYEFIMADGRTYLIERKINQLEEALKKLLTNPSDRRIIVSGWNPAEMDLMALPPCHMDYRFVAFENPKVLNVVMTIRSWDLFLGAPFNISETALFLSIMARLSGYEPGVVTIQATNAHIYSDHYEQVNEILSRDHFAPPSLVLSDNLRRVSSVDEVHGVFERIEPEDIYLQGYESHQAIAAPMAA